MRARVLLVVGVFVLGCSACAMRRATDAQTAQKLMNGMTKEQIFACMGIPKRTGKEGQTEIWAYASGNGRTTRDRSHASTRLSGELSAAFGFGDEVSEKRFCTVNVVLRENRVVAVNYNGPTGGFLTEDEQCAYAVRNCLPKE